jgi:S-adenosylmethionine:tRNA ribosyltransferase-isomerase
MQLADFDFQLPSELIAQVPARPRDAARMLHVTKSGLADRAIRDLPQVLRPDDLLVYNDTRVIKARLPGKRGTAYLEVTLHEPVDKFTWRAFAKPAKKLQVGDIIDFADTLSAVVHQKGMGGEVTLIFSRGGDSLMAALDAHGVMPVPPYIKRPRRGDPSDAEDYQPVWAAREGAVAAPTASLHFTDALLAAIDAVGIKRVPVTLHVGAGTFLPVKADDVTQHEMHAEWAEIPAATAEAINAARAGGRRIVAVGTTALRTLESVADAEGRLRPWHGQTRLFILPGYRFRCVDALLTNFHLPRSTLFMLVAAFAGLERMRAAYTHAIAQRYRFFSYGDACLIERAT